LLAVAGALVADNWWTARPYRQAGAMMRLTNEQDERLQKLERDYPFPPLPGAPGGQPVLDEARLKDYLAVRGRALQRLENAAANLQDMGESDEALGAVAVLFNNLVPVRQTLVDGLEAHQMSMGELIAITMVVYQRTTSEALREHRAQLQARADGLAASARTPTGESRKDVDYFLQEVTQSIQLLPSDQPVLKLDPALLARYQDVIARGLNAQFDMWIIESWVRLTRERLAQQAEEPAP